MHNELRKARAVLSGGATELGQNDNGPPTIILPFVHLNGTSAEELLMLRETAYGALDMALAAMRRMAPNGRDYYPDPGRMDKALEQHRRRQQAIHDIMKELEVECQEIDNLRK